MAEEKKRDMYSLNLNETMRAGGDCWIKRVPGGWIYEYESVEERIAAAVFVPFSEGKFGS